MIRNAGLISLDGAPREIGGDFDCSFNQLTSLVGAPESIGKGFICYHNQLTSLEGAPETVNGNFSCTSNNLTSLKEAPQTVVRDFSCNNNQLTSLVGAPQTVGGCFDCSNNQLTDLDGAPESVGRFSISMWNSDPFIRTLDWYKGWIKKGDAEFTKTLISKLKEINALGSGADSGKPISMLISLSNSVVLSDMLEYLLSLRSSTSDKFKIYGAIKNNIPNVWNKIKAKLDPEGDTSDLMDLGF